jgi:hypothetical protein
MKKKYKRSYKNKNMKYIVSEKISVGTMKRISENNKIEIYCGI